MATEFFLRRRWPEPPEDGADSSETCCGNSTITIYMVLTCTCWVTRTRDSETNGADSVKAVQDYVTVFIWKSPPGAAVTRIFVRSVSAEVIRQ